MHVYFNAAILHLAIRHTTLLSAGVLPAEIQAHATTVEGRGLILIQTTIHTLFKLILMIPCPLEAPLCTAGRYRPSKVSLALEHRVIFLTITGALML